MPHRNEGITLIELMFALAVLAILVSLALPSFAEMLERHRLKTAIEQVYQDLQYVRSEAIKRGTDITVSLKIPAGGNPWCYGFSDAGACDCSADACTIAGSGKNVAGTGFRDVALDATHHTADVNFSFNARRGGATSTSVRLVSTGGYETQVRISALGRVWLCSPDDAMGYPSCP